MDDEILAVLEANAARRWFATILLAGLACVLFYLALTASSQPVWRTVAFLVGGFALWTAQRLRIATGFRVELTETELRDSSGISIARLDDIAGVERGFVAFKPSNGFLLKTKTPGTRIWRPGMWWRFGRRIGIGGVTPGSQARVMTDLLAMRLADRNQVSDHGT